MKQPVTPVAERSDGAFVLPPFWVGANSGHGRVVQNFMLVLTVPLAFSLS